MWFRYFHRSDKKAFSDGDLLFLHVGMTFGDRRKSHKLDNHHARESQPTGRELMWKAFQKGSILVSLKVKVREGRKIFGHARFCYCGTRYCRKMTRSLGLLSRLP